MQLYSYSAVLTTAFVLFTSTHLAYDAPRDPLAGFWERNWGREVRGEGEEKDRRCSLEER